MVEKSNKPKANDVAQQLAAMSITNISAKTVRRRLHEEELYGRAPIKKP